MKKILMLMIVASIPFMWACNKEDDFQKLPTEGKAFNEMKIQSGFDWKTTKSYTFNIKGYANNIVKIVSENSKTTFLSAMIKSGVNEELKVTIPSYEKSVHLMYMGQDILLPLNSTSVNYNFN